MQHQNVINNIRMVELTEGALIFAAVATVFLRFSSSAEKRKVSKAKTDFLYSLPKWHEESNQDVFTRLTNEALASSQSSGKKKQIVIVGAGIVGLSVALRAKLILGESVDITIMSETFLHQTTSQCCGGLWEPYQIAGTPDEQVNQWGQYTFEHFRELLYSPDAGAAGVQLMTNYVLVENGQEVELPSWKDVPIQCAEIPREEFQRMNLPKRFTGGYSFGTFVVDQKYYMQYLTKQLKRMGVKFVQKKVLSLEMFETGIFDAVVNCTGLGAATLLPDKEMYPIRGQVMRIRAPWLKSVWFFGTSYIIPNIDNVVIGGTAQKGNWSTTNSVEDCEKIVNDICEVFPSIREALVEGSWAGLRPGRTTLRLNSEVKELDNVFESEGDAGGSDRRPKQLHILHCYGHGGSGVTLGMGCAEDVVRNHLLPRLFPEIA